MKRILIILSALLISATAIAQTSTQVNFGTLQRKIDKSDQDIENPKRNEKHQTWISRGELMLEVYDAMLLSASNGLGINDFLIIIGRPIEQIEEEQDGVPVTKMVMEKVTFTFVDGILDTWTFTDPLVEDPLNEGYRSFVKAHELDTRERVTDKIKENLMKIKYLLIDEGSNCYRKKDYSCSFESFAKSIEISHYPLVNYVDTVVLYYAALSAQLSEKYEDAIEYYKKSLDYEFHSEGNAYYNIYEAYISLGMDDEGLKYLQEGFVKVPSNQNVLYGLINHYISRDDDPNAVLVYIHKAIEVEPNDYALHFAEGTLHDQLENYEHAEKSYKKSIELNPDFFDAIFNLGALYYNTGVKINEEALKVPAKDFEKYDELVTKANAEFRKSIPIMELALEVNPNNLATVETLKNLYFRFRNDSKEMENKFNEINELWSTLQ